MDPNSLLVSALINVLASAIKGIPKIKADYLPLIAIGLGIIIWPIYSSKFDGETFVVGALVGAGAVGLYEAAARIGKPKKETEILNQV